MEAAVCRRTTTGDWGLIMSGHISGAKTCALPGCNRPPHPLIPWAICAHHAMGIHAHLEDLKATATWGERATAARPPQDPKRVKQGWGIERGEVYFARCGPLIKIGWSSNAKQRIKALGADELLLTIEGTMQDEKAMHHRFGPSWDHGEYFHPSPDLMAFIEAESAGG